MKKLSNISKLTLLSAIAGLGITLISSFTIFLGYPGWTIGIAIGSLIDVAIVALLYVGGDRTLQTQKIGITYLFYILRMILLVAGLLLPAILEYKLHIEVMKYSTFGSAIGYLPGAFVIVLFFTSKKHDEENK